MLAVVTALAVGWKWQLSVLGSVVFALAVGMSVAIVLTVTEPIMHLTPVVGALVMWGATIGIGLAALVVVFFRDPEREATNREDVIDVPPDFRSRVAG